MGKQAVIEIPESIETLKKLRSKQKNMTGQKRITSLMYIKTSKFKTRKELSTFLCVHIRTLERWIVKYKEQGIEGILEVKPKVKGSKIITKDIHAGLEQRAYDPDNPFLGYWDAQNWVKEQYGIDVKYQRIREYMIQHFKTKIKKPRKSHIKKDNQAIEAFLKTTTETKTY